MHNIFLIGFMGVGKSTIAKLLAKELQAELVEMDETIEAEAGMLGQPVCFKVPEVVGVHISGTANEDIGSSRIIRSGLSFSALYMNRTSAKAFLSP